MTHSRRLGRLAPIAAGLVLAGCTSEPPPSRSVDAAADPARHEQAKAEAAAVEAQAKQAEAAVLGNQLDGLEGR